MNLYQLEDNLMKVVEMAESADEDDQQKFNDTIDSLKSSIVDKAVSYAHVIKQLKADSKQLNEKIQHDVAVKRSIDNNVDKLKGALQQGMEMAGKDKIKDLDMSIWIQNNAPSVRHVDDDLIPSKYIKQEPKIQTQAILNDLKQGIEVPGAELQQTKSIRIK
jgi:hypothetical protein